MEVVEGVARRVASRYGEVLKLTRFPLGLCHFVYDVVLADGASLVVRIASAENAAMLEAGYAWSAILRPLGVPLPTILDADRESTEHGELSYQVLERIRGTDLGNVYDSLTSAQRARLASEVVEVGRIVARLPRGEGFGYVASPTGPFPQISWMNVVERNLARSRGRLPTTQRATMHEVVERRAAQLRAYLDSVPPLPFLDDLTTKNVLVHEGALSGVVDVDAVCFGDPLYTPALTRAALYGADRDLDYVYAWLDALQPCAEQVRAFDFYTAVFALDLLSEHGQHFNRERSVVLEPETTERLHELIIALDE